MEHVAGGETRLPLVVCIPLCALKVAITPDDLLGLGIPHDELLVAVLAGVELVDVHRLACAASSLAEGNLAQSTYLLHHVGCVVGRDDVYLVVTLVGHAELTLGSKLLLEYFFVDGGDDLLFHFPFVVCELQMIAVRVYRLQHGRTEPSRGASGSCRRSARGWACRWPRGSSCGRSCTFRRRGRAWQG